MAPLGMRGGSWTPVQSEINRPENVESESSEALVLWKKYTAKYRKINCDFSSLVMGWLVSGRSSFAKGSNLICGSYACLRFS